MQESKIYLGPRIFANLFIFHTRIHLHVDIKCKRILKLVTGVTVAMETEAKDRKIANLISLKPNDKVLPLHSFLAHKTTFVILI